MTSQAEKIQIFDAEIGKTVLVDKIDKTPQEWKKELTPQQYDITVMKGTEASGTCSLLDQKGQGIYKCVRCGTCLFFSDTKFDSGTGWPSYFEPVSELNIKYVKDSSYGMERTEVLCARCDSHLGHVFDDGPLPSRKRFCINGVALLFLLKGKSDLEEATFGGGCFWHIEEAFSKIKGVRTTEVGFSGGTVPEPSYEKVCSGSTGHAEVVHIKFDPRIVSYNDLLDVFWSLHDPTQMNRQGPDIGEQYRSVIYYYNERQKNAALLSKEKLGISLKHDRPIVTQILPASKFFRAEEYHQKYFNKHR